MKIFAGIFIFAFLVGCAAPCQVGAADPIIDIGSWDTINASIAAAKPEDRQIVGEIPCDLGHTLGLDPSNPKQRELLLEQLRVQFRGKTVAQVAAEVRAKQKSKSGKLQMFADDYISKRQQRWKSRAQHVSSVAKGIREEDILTCFGKPDSKTSSDTATTLFYWISAYLKDGQICEDFIEFKIERGVVVDFRQATGFRQQIADLYKQSHK